MGIFERLPGKLRVASVRSEEGILDGMRQIVFTAKSPWFPGEKPEKEVYEASGQRMTGMEFVSRLDNLAGEIPEDIKNFGYDYENRREGEDLARYSVVQKDGKWYAYRELPPTIQSIFIKALQYEATHNPQINDFKRAHIVWSLFTQEPPEDRTTPHFDSGNGISSYLVASAPTTVQYLPTSPETTLDRSQIYKPGVDDESHPRTPAKQWFEETGAPSGMGATSILPMCLYHFDENTLHSRPWEMFPQGVSNEGTPRFFCRITFDTESEEEMWKRLREMKRD